MSRPSPRREDEIIDGISVVWILLFADVPSSDFARAARFWPDVLGGTRAAPRGDRGEYLPIEPLSGDSSVWLQRVDRADGGWHPDLSVPDLAGGLADVRDLGARPVRVTDGLITLTTPAGQPFCLVQENPGRTRHRPAPNAFPSGRSRLDQLCLDIPVEEFEAECEFWRPTTGWPRLGSDLPDFDRLDVPEDLPLRILLQRTTHGPVRAHADFAADDRSAEVRRHEECGAAIERRLEHWTTLPDPTGLRYCITDRQP